MKAQKVKLVPPCGETVEAWFIEGPIYPEDSTEYILLLHLLVPMETRIPVREAHRMLRVDN